MDPITQNIALNLAASFLYQLGQSATGKAHRLIQTDPKKKALEQVFQSAFSKCLDEVAGHLDSNLQKHVQGLLSDFLKQDSVGTTILNRLVDLDTLPIEDLEKAFNKLDFDSGTLPVSFEILMRSLMENTSIAFEQELARTDSPLASEVNTKRLRGILAEAKGLTHSMNRVQDCIQESAREAQNHTTQILGRIDGLSDKLGLENPVASGLYDSAKNALKVFNIASARGILSDIKDNHWDSCSSDLKSKTLSLFARVHELSGSIEEAARFRGQASDLTSDPRERDIQRAYAFALLNDNLGAFKIAESLVVNAPNTADGWNILIQTSPDDVSLDSLEDQIPATVISDADVLAGLAQKARKSGNFAKAIEYSRKALNKAPEMPLAYYYVAESLLQTFSGIAPGATLSSEMRATLEEAVDHLRNGLKRAGESAPPWIRLLFQTNKAFALRLLARYGEALEDLAALHAILPNELQVILDYARMLGNLSQHSEAIRVLELFLSNNQSDMASVFLIESLLDQEKPDLVKVLEVAESALNHQMDDAFARQMIIHHCLYCAHESQDNAKAEEILSRSAHLDEIARRALRIEHLRLSGKQKDAQEALQAMTGTMARVSDRHKLRYVARLMDQVGLHRDALDLWRRIVPDDMVTADTASFLGCARRCKSILDVLQICRGLRQRDFYSMFLYTNELWALNELNELTASIELTQTYIERITNDEHLRHLRLQLSMLGYIACNESLCETNLDLLPAVNEVDPGTGEDVVKLLLATQQSTSAMEYAYKLYRRFPSSLEANRAMVGGLGHDFELGATEFTRVEAGHAVNYRALKGTKSGWIILEDGPDPDATRSEYGPDHPLFRELLGKQVGATFVLSAGAIQSSHATIERVISKFIYRLQECLRTLPENFGTEGGIEMVSLEGAEPGSFDPSPILRDLDVREKAIDAVVQEYSKRKLPLCLVAGALGRSVLETVSALHSETETSLFCCTGIEREASKARAQLRSANSLVIDLSALSVLIISRNIAILSDLDIQVYVSEGVIRQLRSDLRAAKESTAYSGWLGKHKGQYTLQDANISARSNWARELEDAIDSIERNCMVVGGSVTLELPSKIQSEFSIALPRPEVETIALARRDRAVLWTDDWCLYTLANSEFKGQARVWTQLVISELVERTHSMRLTEAKVSGTLLRLGFIHLRISVDTVRHLVKESGFAPEHEAFQALLRQYDGMAADARSMFQYTAFIVKTCWQDALVDSQKEALTNAVLHFLRHRRFGRLIIEAILNSTEDIFGLDVPNQSRCETYISAWTDTNIY